MNKIESQAFYDKHYYRMDAYEDSVHSELDKMVLLISTGVLVLSVNYLTGFKNNLFSTKWSLVLTWVFLVLCIMSQLYNHYLVAKHSRVFKNTLDVWRKNKYIEDVDSILENNTHLDRLEKYAYLTSSASIILVALGVIFMTFFAVSNFLRTTDEIDKMISKKNNTVLEEKIYTLESRLDSTNLLKAK